MRLLEQNQIDGIDIESGKPCKYHLEYLCKPGDFDIYHYRFKQIIHQSGEEMATTLGNRRLKTTELFIEVDGSELDDIYSDPSIFWYHFMKLYSNYRLLPLNWAQYEDTGKIEFYGCDECCYKASITDIYRRDSVLRYREGISYGAGGENRRYTIYTIPMYVPTSIIPVSTDDKIVGLKHDDAVKIINDYINNEKKVVDDNE